MIGKPALQSKPKKRLTRKKKENIHSPPNHHPTHFILLISWGACSQSALPLKSYRGAEKQPYVGLQMHWQYIIILYSSKTPQESSSSHDLAAYSLSSSFHFHANGNPERFCSLSCVIVDIHYECWFHPNMQISKFYREAFGHLLFVIIFQPLAVNPPHSSMLLHL